MIGLVALALAFSLATQDCSDAESIFRIGPLDDLPELNIPRVVTVPYLVPPQNPALRWSDGIPVVLISTTIFLIFEYSSAERIGATTSLGYVVPLFWRFNNPATAPPM